MRSQRIFTTVVLSSVLSCTISLQALAEANHPLNKGTRTSVESELNAAAVDAPQTVDVSQASLYTPIVPCRIADTRNKRGRFGLPIGPGLTGGQQRGFWGWAGEGCETDEGGNPLDEPCYDAYGGSPVECGIPSTATAVHVNISVVDPQGKGFMRSWPVNTPFPNATILSWGPGPSVTNAATIPICSDGTEFPNPPGFLACLYDDPDDDTDDEVITDFFIKIFSSKPEHVVIDALGYYAAP